MRYFPKCNHYTKLITTFLQVVHFTKCYNIHPSANMAQYLWVMSRQCWLPRCISWRCRGPSGRSSPAGQRAAGSRWGGGPGAAPRPALQGALGSHRGHTEVTQRSYLHDTPQLPWDRSPLSLWMWVCQTIMRIPYYAQLLEPLVFLYSCTIPHKCDQITRTRNTVQLELEGKSNITTVDMAQHWLQNNTFYFGNLKKLNLSSKVFSPQFWTVQPKMCVIYLKRCPWWFLRG